MQYLTQIDSPLSLKISAKVQELKRAGKDIIDLTIGQPDLRIHPIVEEAMVRSIKEGQTGYTAGLGITGLRSLINDYCNKKYGLNNCLEQIVVTQGAKAAIFCTLKSFLNDGDEVLIPSPSWLSYSTITQLAGGIPVDIPLPAQCNFTTSHLDWESIITPRTRAVIICNPVNPTGLAWPAQELVRLFESARRHNLFLLYDAIYDDLVFDNSTDNHKSTIASLGEQLILIHGMSKTYSMTGLRVGYFIANKSIAKIAGNIHLQLSTCANSIGQHGAIAALKLPETFLSERAAIYASRSKLFCKELESQNLSFIVPHGTFYCFVDTSTIAESGAEAAEQFLKLGVACIPGEAYGESAKNFVRFSMTVEEKELLSAINRIALTGRNNPSSR